MAVLGDGTMMKCGFPGGSVVKTLPANAGNAGDAGSISAWEGPLEEEMTTHSSILAGKFHGQRSLADYSSCSCKESDMTEHTLAHTHIEDEVIKFK